MADNYVTISDLNEVSTISDVCKILVDDSTGGDTRFTLLKTIKDYIVSGIRPSINTTTNTWFIGSVDTGVVATQRDFSINPIDLLNEVIGTLSIDNIDGGHKHDNLATISKFTEIDGKPYFDGNEISSSTVTDTSVVKSFKQMPEPNESLVNTVVQYTGNNTNDLSMGNFYECILNSSNSTYFWSKINNYSTLEPKDINLIIEEIWSE